MKKLFLSIVAASIIIAANFAPASAQKKNKKAAPPTRDITIYVYQRPAADSGEFHGTIVPVKRKIVNYKPLDKALKLLLKGTNKAERRRGLSDFIFELKFYSARIKNKTAQINFKFIYPEIAEESWEGGGFDYANFAKAVEQTAKQFPGVERVSICVDGEKYHYNEDPPNPGKCPFPMFR